MITMVAVVESSRGMPAKFYIDIIDRHRTILTVWDDDQIDCYKRAQKIVKFLNDDDKGFSLDELVILREILSLNLHSMRDWDLDTTDPNEYNKRVSLNLKISSKIENHE